MRKSSCTKNAFSIISLKKWTLITGLMLALIFHSRQEGLAQESFSGFERATVTEYKHLDILQEAPSKSTDFDTMRIAQPNNQALLQANNTSSTVAGVLQHCAKDTLGLSDNRINELTSNNLKATHWTEGILYYLLFDLTFILVMGFFIALINLAVRSKQT